MGKLSPVDLDRCVFSWTGAPSSDLLIGAGYGEDAAAVATGKGTVVINTNPISLTTGRIGTLGVTIASNDVTTYGGVPEWLVSTILLPKLDVNLPDDITAQLDAGAEQLGINIVDGHTETVVELSRPLLSFTCMGPTGRYVPTSGVEPGDAVILIKGTGVEGTAALTTGFRADLDAASVELAATGRAAGFFDDVSVLSKPAMLVPAATAIHNPTESGVLNELVGLTCASGVRVEVGGNGVPVRPKARVLCKAMGVDPMRILGSDALLAAVPEDETDDMLAALGRGGIEMTVAGTVKATGDGAGSNADADSTAPTTGIVCGGTYYVDDTEDGMYDLWN